MDKALFSLESFRFEEVEMHLGDTSSSMKLSIVPSGVFFCEESRYELLFVFNALKDDMAEEGNDVVVSITCKASFKFTDIHSLNDIPDFFYSNSIAILFPYVRSFISSVTLQANVMPIVLPVMNLSSLQETLKNKTEVC